MTEAQRVAHARNWRIHQLRMMHSAATGNMSPRHAEAVKRIIDAELRDLGAETEADRRAKWRAELLSESGYV